MDSLSRRFSSRPKHDSSEDSPSRRNGKEKFSSQNLHIVPVPPEELPEGMKSVLESFISPQRPSLVDTTLAHQTIPHASTSDRHQSPCSPMQAHERYEYDGRNDLRVRGPNSKWPFNFDLKGKNIPSRVFHTHKVVPRSRPNAKEQMGKRKWHPSRRHGRVIRQEDYDAYAARELGQSTRFLNNESFMDLSIRGGRVVKGRVGRAVGGSRFWRWVCGGEVAGKVSCHG